MIGRIYEEEIAKCEAIEGFGDKVVDKIKKEVVLPLGVDRIDRLTIKFKDGTEMIIISWDQESYKSGLDIEEKILE